MRYWWTVIIMALVGMWTVSSILAQEPPREGVQWFSAQLEVIPPGLMLVMIEPLLGVVEEGEQLQFKATGHYTDGTTGNLTREVLWVSMDSTVATIDAETGLATGVKRGSVDVAIGWKP